MLKFSGLIKKHGITLLWTVIICLLLFVPNAKALLLKGLIQVGLFKVSPQKEMLGISKVAISFRTKDGLVINTGDMKGKVIFINFWATWCPPCIAEMPSINKLYNSLKEDPHIVFISADADNDFSKSLPFMEKHGYQLPVYGIASDIPNTIFPGSLPTTIIIDSNGNLVQRHVGLANFDTKEMMDFLRLL